MRSSIRLIAALAAFMSGGACSPSQGDPTAATSGEDRIFKPECPAPGPTKGGDTYVDIYNDLLGPKSVTKCQDPACHGGASEQGGFRMKDTIDEAYQGMKDYGLLFPGAMADPMAPAGTPHPAVAGLLRVVTPLASTGVPKMPRPLCGNRALTAAEIDRIKRWAEAGARP